MSKNDLSKQLQDIYLKHDKEHNCLKNDHYVLHMTVWILDESLDEGARNDTMHFSSLKDAQKCKKLINEMISQQKRHAKGKIETVTLGSEEYDFWMKRLGKTNYQLFYSTDTIWHVTREKVG